MERADGRSILGKAMDGARRLAAAVVLTGDAGIQVPDGDHSRTGIDAASVLADWEPDDVQTLLERGIFDDVIYGAVRFRHRDIRELLAAAWFSELLQRGRSRHEIEGLFFREQYGQQMISPRLRVILPWLILEDGDIRERTLAAHPDVALEGGDPARLPLPIRQQILSDVVGRIVQGEDRGSNADNSGLARIAATDLTDQTLALIDQFPDNDKVLFFLGRLVWQGAMSGCVPRLMRVAADPGAWDLRSDRRYARHRDVRYRGATREQSGISCSVQTARSLVQLLAEFDQGHHRRARR